MTQRASQTERDPVHSPAKKPGSNNVPQFMRHNRKECEYAKDERSQLSGNFPLVPSQDEQSDNRADDTNHGDQGLLS